MAWTWDSLRIRVTLMTVLIYDLVSSELTYGNGGRQYLLDWGIRRLYVKASQANHPHYLALAPSYQR